ncbi:MAG: Mur ligase family protein [Geminicoccaceae bacterium]
MGLGWRDITALATSRLGRQRLAIALRGLSAPALRPVAGLYRRTVLRRVRIVAVTGSVGKTTTVRMLLAVLHLPLTRLLGLLVNGMWAVPRRLLEIGPAARWGVIEIGIDRAGLMARQADAVAPDIAVITAVAGEHLETLGSLDAIAREKSRLLAALRSGGVAVLNGDDSRVRAMAAAAPGQVWTFGFGPDNDVRAVGVAVDWPRGMRFLALVRGEPVPVAIPLLGRHMVPPALAALAVAAIEGIPLIRAAESLAATRPAAGRLQVVPLPGGITFLMDHQKNSVASLIAAVELAAEAPGRKVLAIAALRSGTAAAELQTAGKLIARVFSHVVAIGEDVEELLAAVAAAGLPAERILRTAPGVLDTIACLRRLLRDGDVVLVKSRGFYKLDRLVLALQGREVACDLVQCRLFTQRCAVCPALGTVRTGRFG